MYHATYFVVAKHVEKRVPDDGAFGKEYGQDVDGGGPPAPHHGVDAEDGVGQPTREEGQGHEQDRLGGGALPPERDGAHPVARLRLGVLKDMRMYEKYIRG